ncbi:MAG: hypothetical protein MUC88_00290 [Planctomycetes bacterium]|nr:hypothetical protein [Planctomycetota bacterium]
MKCEDCRYFYFNQHDEEEEISECRRRAPQVVCNPVERVLDSYWPDVMSDDWCGEYAGKTQKSQEPACKARHDKREGRAMPHNLEAEKSVLSIIANGPVDAAEYLVGALSRQDFYHPGHASIFAALQEACHSGKPPPDEAATVMLHRADPKKAAFWARVVLDKALLRRMIATCSELAAAAFGRPSGRDDLPPILE